MSYQAISACLFENEFTASVDGVLTPLIDSFSYDLSSDKLKFTVMETKEGSAQQLLEKLKEGVEIRLTSRLVACIRKIHKNKIKMSSKSKRTKIAKWKVVATVEIKKQ